MYKFFRRLSRSGLFSTAVVVAVAGCLRRTRVGQEARVVDRAEAYSIGPEQDAVDRRRRWKASEMFGKFVSHLLFEIWPPFQLENFQ